MFSPQDYELAARVLGLPVPQTAAERAAAAPMTAVVLRNFHRAAPPMPGHELDGIHTGATRSLNAQPRTTMPEARGQLAHRLQAGVVSESDQDELENLLALLLNDEEMMVAFIEFLRSQGLDSGEAGEYLSRQRPLEYDLPNYGGQYSVLNAPSSSSIPASVRYQELG